ncbi:hypothetical protein K505DRAFT_28991 [Melanomma pulvis-pyrius CBS 109.77]|uniref:Uncharacterized protein n=1 Tax=Melanomma pulvis-pyrius CBS 109.77 TaxID=1314802 RepID=A0A6A6XUZ9_9PLEO|nr:hypothetical protein K505DRAFT_28991 [Melanomma pulvis-pyrius CBS 109.77]
MLLAPSTAPPHDMTRKSYKIAASPSIHPCMDLSRPPSREDALFTRTAGRAPPPAAPPRSQAAPRPPSSRSTAGSGRALRSALLSRRRGRLGLWGGRRA